MTININSPKYEGNFYLGGNMQQLLPLCGSEEGGWCVVLFQHPITL